MPAVVIQLSPAPGATLGVLAAGMIGPDPDIASAPSPTTTTGVVAGVAAGEAVGIGAWPASGSMTIPAVVRSMWREEITEGIAWRLERESPGGMLLVGMA